LKHHPPARRGSFRILEKTVHHLSESLEATLFAENTAQRPGLLQGIDPRVKVISLLLLVVTVALVQGLPFLGILYLIALALAALSRIPLGFFLKRTLVFIPLFTGVIALPAIFNVVSPGKPLIVLYDIGRPLSWGPIGLPQQLAITDTGITVSSRLILRVSASLSFTVLLLLTTRWASLLKALRVLGVPRVFVVILGMTYRYIYLLLHTVNTMFLARKSRTVGRLSAGEHRRWLTTTMGLMVDKSYTLSENVYQAMLSRGFRGEVSIMDTFALHRADIVWACITLAMATGIFMMDRL